MTDAAPTHPLVTVVLPVRNEACHLSSCLTALLSQTYPADRLEILVVDGCSEDDTRRIAMDVASLEPRMRVLDNDGRLAARALNIGIKAAKGEIIVRVDGHTIVPPEYVAECVSALQATGADVVGGPRTIVGESFWGRCIALALRSPFASPARFHRQTAMAQVDSVFLGAFLRATLLRVGLFAVDLSWNEDYELNYRIRRAGGQIWSTPRLASTYYVRETLPALARQYWGYGRGKAMVLGRHPRSGAVRHVVAPLFVLALAGVVILAGRGEKRPLTCVFGAYAVAAACFAVRAVAGYERAQPSAVVVFVLFPVVHVAWGAGLLAELARGTIQALTRRMHSMAAEQSR